MMSPGQASDTLALGLPLGLSGGGRSAGGLAGATRAQVYAETGAASRADWRSACDPRPDAWWERGGGSAAGGLTDTELPASPQADVPTRGLGYGEIAGPLLRPVKDVRGTGRGGTCFRSCSRCFCLVHSFVHFLKKKWGLS